MSKKFFKHSSAYAKALCCLAFLMMFTSPVYSQQIIIDGNTNTTINTVGAVSDVTTGTVVNSNAFNSFTRFNVDAGNTVNLQVPDNAANLINIVRNEASNINGILNSYQNGVMGGNIYLVNPHGIVVGQTGCINVGSLTAVTSTQAFADGFFTGPGNPNAASVQALLEGTAPVNPDAVITIDGQINAIDDVNIQAGTINNNGLIMTDAEFDDQSGGVVMSDIVNLNSIETASNRDFRNLCLENGEIKLVATTQINHDGEMYAGSSIAMNAPIINTGTNDVSRMGVGAGNIEISGTNEIYLLNSFVEATGDLTVIQNTADTTGLLIANSILAGDNSINITADSIDFVVDNNSSIVPELFSDGDINVESTSTTQGIKIAGARIDTTGTVNISTADLQNEWDTGIIIKKGSEISGNSGINISTNAEIIVQDESFISSLNGPLNINSNEFTMGMFPGEDNSSIAGAGVSINAPDGIHIGSSNIGSTSDINLNSEFIVILQNSTIESINGNINLGSEEAPTEIIEIVGIDSEWSDEVDSPILNAMNGNISLYGHGTILTGLPILRGKDVTISSDMLLLGHFPFAEAEFMIPSGVDIEAENLYINANEQLSMYGSLTKTTGETVINTGNIAENGLIFVPDQLETTVFSSNFLTPGNDLQLISEDEIIIGNLNRVIIDGNQLNINNLDLQAPQITLEGDITANNDIILNGNNIKLINTELYANNITIDPSKHLRVEESVIETPGLLTINQGDVENRGLYFYPESIIAGTLQSDFIAPDSPIVFNINTGDGGNVVFGNIDNIQIGGNPLNVTDIDLQLTNGSDIKLGGLINVPGYIYLIANNITLAEGTISGEDIFINPFGKLKVKDVCLTANNRLTLNSGNRAEEGIYFIPESITTPELHSDFLQPDAAINIISEGPIDFGNLDNITVGGNPLNPTGFALLSTDSVVVEGCNTISGPVNLLSKTVKLLGGELRSNHNISISFEKNIAIDGVSIITDGTLGLHILGDQGIKNVTFIPDLIEAAALDTGLINENGDIIIEDLKNVELGNLNNIFIGGNQLEINNIEIVSDFAGLYDGITVSGDIYLETNGLEVEGTITAGGDIALISLEDSSYGPHIEEDSVITAGGDIWMHNGNKHEGAIVERNATLEATGAISIGSLGYTTIEEGVNLTANEIEIGAKRNVLIQSDVEMDADTYLSIVSAGKKPLYSVVIEDGASLGAGEEVEIKAKGGEIYIWGADISSDGDMTIKAANHIRIGSDSFINADGSILLKQNGDDYDVDGIWQEQNSIINGIQEVDIVAMGDFINEGLFSSDDLVIIDLYAGDINQTADDALISAQRIFMGTEYGEIGDDENSINIDLTASELRTVALGDINITEVTGNMDVVMAESVFGDVSLTALDGSILFTPRGEYDTVQGININLNAPQGSIGLFDQPVDILPGIDGILNVNAGGYVNINAVAGDIIIGEISNNGLADMKLSVPNGSLLALEGNNNIADIITRGLEIYAGSEMPGSIGTELTPIKIDTNYNSVGGNVLALASEDILLHEVSGDLFIQTVSNAGNGDVFIQADGSIVDATPVWEPNIYSNNLTLISDKGTIGNLLDGIDVAVNNNHLDGVLKAQAEGIIHINQLIDGVDLSVAGIYSNSGDVELSSNSGIVGAPLELEGATHITGNDIFLYAGETGTIGSEDTSLTLRFLDNGSLEAIGNDYISITAPYGDINIIEVTNGGAADVSLSASNNIHSLGLLDGPVIQAHNLALLSYLGGEIGTADNAINIDLSAGGILTATANGVININEFAGDMIVDVVTNSGKADVKLSAPDGSILDNGDEETDIFAHSLELNAGIGANHTIGTDNTALDIDTNADGTTDGTLTAMAGGSIVLYETEGDLNLNVVSNAGRDDVVLISDGSILNSHPGQATPAVYGNNITLVSIDGSIGKGPGTEILPVALNYNLLGGVLNAYAENDIFISQLIAYANMNIDEVTSNTGNVSLFSQSSIIDGQDGPGINIDAKNIQLVSNATIGAYDNDLDIDLNEGLLSVEAAGFINIHAPEGDLVINSINNQGLDGVKLVSSGNILAGTDNLEAEISGRDIYLCATNGTIGELINPNMVNTLDLDTNQTGVVTALANGLIALGQNLGDMRINVISNAGKDDVVLWAKGSILDGSPWTQNSTWQPNIYGNTISLTSESGTIGTMQDSIDLALNNNLLGGTLYARAQGNINLNQMINGVNMNVGKVLSTGGDVKLSSNSGIIDGLDIDPGVATNITANNITLIATNNSSIGTFDNDLDIKLNNNGMLTAFGYGYINIGAEGNLKLDVVSNAGRADVQLHASGNIIPNDDLITPEIISRGLTLISDLGNIGIIDNLGYNTLDFDTNYAGGNGTVTALAQGYIEIYETNGNMLVNAISNAGRDEVFVWAKDSILDGSVLEQANIFGKDIIIESETGSIGTAADKVDVYTNYNNWGGVLDAYTPEGSLYINQIAKNLYLGEIEASNIAAISATAGGIYTYTGYPEINITSAKLFMETPVAIGNQFKPVVVDVSGPIGAGSPSVYIRNVH